jgi:hypothetical protein
MSDERDLTPDQEARVARLLADARVEEPLPAEVAARLDRVLAGLADEPVPGPERAPAPVTDLAARRRRRVRMLLVAAAAVVVAGVGVGQLIEPRGSDDAADSTSAGENEDGVGAGSDDDRAAPESAASSDAPDLLTEDQLESLGEPARINRRSFAADVRRLQDHPGVRSDSDTGMLDGSDLAAPEMDFSCGSADFGTGKMIAVLYRGTPSVLAYRPPAGDTQVVELLQCGSGDVIRSTTVPLP